MCLNKKYINIHNGRELLVNCGYCEACLQEKAINRVNRIKGESGLTSHSETGRKCIFFHLGYSNAFIPFFYEEEFKNAPIYKKIHHNEEGLPDGESYYRMCNIYRLSDIRFKRVKGSYNTKASYTGFQYLKSIPVPFPLGVNDNFKGLQNDIYKHRGKRVSVCYFPDVQNFEKRLRINWKRKHGTNFECSLFNCTEYGPTTSRSHLHLLMWVPYSYDFNDIVENIVRSWPYERPSFIKRRVEYARDPAGYVASYVNSDSSIPYMLKNTKGLAPRHSYSKNFGVRAKEFSLSEVWKAFLRKDLRYTAFRTRQGSLVMDNVLLPKYVIHRYAPKFKGYCKLSCDELYSLCLDPSTIGRYSKRCCLTPDDEHRISTMLYHKRVLFDKHNISIPDFADFYSRVWQLRASQVMRQWYERQIDYKQILYAYDNITDYVSGDIYNSRLEEVCRSLPPDFEPILDPNNFPDNVNKHNTLVTAFHNYKKLSKVNDKFYSQYE